VIEIARIYRRGEMERIRGIGEMGRIGEREKRGKWNFSLFLPYFTLSKIRKEGRSR
jgi:hypothetical protein